VIAPIAVACALPMLSAGAHAAFSAWVLRRYPAEGEFIRVDGARQHVVVRGSGPPVVLVHGANGVHHDFPPELIDELARGHTVLAIDRPGHGFSEALPGRVGLAAHAAALVAVLRERCSEPALIVGHSYGTVVALRAALDEPARVQAVLALTPVFATDARNQRWSQLAALGPLAALATWTCALPIALAVSPSVRRDAWHPASPPRPFAASRAFPLRPAQMLVAADDLRRLGPDLESLRADLPSLRAPLTILAGEFDRITPWKSHARPMHEAVPGSRLVRVSNAGHWLLRQQPGLVADEILRLSRDADPS